MSRIIRNFEKQQKTIGRLLDRAAWPNQKREPDQDQAQALEKKKFKHEKKKYQDDRGDKLREQVTQNQQRQEAMKMLWEGDPRGEMMLRTGGGGGSGGGGGGASAGLSRKDALAQATTEYENMPPTADGPSINEYVNQRAAEIMQQSPQPQTLAGRMREFRARRDYDEAASLQNLQQNLITSYVDAEGNPISAEGVQRAEGGQNYGRTPEGTQAFRKFSLAGVGYDLPMGEPPEMSIAERGFQLSDAQRAALKEKASGIGPQGEKVDTDETPSVVQALEKFKKDRHITDETWMPQYEPEPGPTVFEGALSKKVREGLTKAKRVGQTHKALQKDWNSFIKEHGITPEKLNTFHALASQIKQENPELEWQEIWEMAIKDFKG